LLLSFGCCPLLLLTNLYLAGIPHFFHSIWLLTSLLDLDLILLSLAFVLPDLIIGFAGSHHCSFAGSIYGFVGFLILFGSSFGFIGSTSIHFVKFFAPSGFVYHIACLPVASCIIVSTTVAAPSGSLQPELCLP